MEPVALLRARATSSIMLSTPNRCPTATAASSLKGDASLQAVGGR